ncbi:MAG: M28 family peptidase [Ignavibacteriae bacterium]|nr:M28 family peptidase [Ignavibacteriota bacterium]
MLLSMEMTPGTRKPDEDSGGWNMKTCGIFAILVWLLVCGCPSHLNCQTCEIQSIADSVNLDSLRVHVRCLADDTTFSLGDESYRIAGRYDSTGRKVARLYLKTKLDAYGLVTRLDTFGVATNYSIADVNVLAEQPGTLEPDVKVIIGAHYDALVGGQTIAPGADGNASGVATVLEVARVMSHYSTRHTIVYALWDACERGRLGSTSYATKARARGDSIRAVLNVIMTGWDSVQTSRGEIWVRAFAQSQGLGDSLLALSRDVNTGITMSVFNPVLVGSDHVSFWQQGYNAVSITGKYMEGNRSPYVGTVNDRVAHMNFQSFLGRARFSAAATAYLAGGGQVMAAVPLHAMPTSASLSQNYPNPFNPSSWIRYAIPTTSQVSLAIFNTLGQEVAVLVRGVQDAGYHDVKFDAMNLPSGVYFYRLEAGSYTETKKLILIR